MVYQDRLETNCSYSLTQKIQNGFL